MIQRRVQSSGFITLCGSKKAMPAVSFMLVSWLAYISTLEMKALCSPKPWTIRRYSPKDVRGLISNDTSNTECCHLQVVKKNYSCNRPRRLIGLWDVEAPTFSLDSRLTDGGKVVSLTRRPPYTSQEDSWYSFLLEADSTPGPYCGWKD
jgi:hypothetical protein